jgi:hypothetical protein
MADLSLYIFIWGTPLKKTSVPSHLANAEERMISTH